MINASKINFIRYKRNEVDIDYKENQLYPIQKK